MLLFLSVSLLAISALFALCLHLHRRHLALTNLRLGDTVRTSSGICGIVTAFDRDTVTLESGTGEIVLELKSIRGCRHRGAQK